MSTAFFEKLVDNLSAQLQEKDKIIAHWMEENRQLKEQLQQLQQQQVQQPEKAPKQPKEKYTKLKWGPNFVNYFTSKGFAFDESEDLKDAMDRYSEETNTGYEIGTKDTIYYKTEKDFEKVVQLKVNIDSIREVLNNNSLNTIAFMRPTQSDVKKNSDLDLVNSLFGINGKGPVHATQQIISKTLKAVGFNNLTNEEDNINTFHTQGAVHYIKQNNLTIAKAYSFDINSHHPSILADSNFVFPIRAHMQPQLVKEITDTAKTAIYVLKVDKNSLKEKLPYFVQADTKENRSKIFYSNYMVQLFDKVGVKYELFNDWTNNKPFNCLQYRDTDLRNGKDLFGDIINKLYTNKSDKGCKDVITRLFGCMTQTSRKNTEVSETNIDEATNLVNEADNDPDSPPKTVVRAVDSSTFDTARIKIFFYDYIRFHMYANFIENKPEILRIKSDSVLYNGFLKTIEKSLGEDLLGNDLGQLKREGQYCNVEYPHVNYSFKTSTDFENTAKSYAKFWNKESQKFE